MTTYGISQSLVNEDAGPAGQQIVDGLVSGLGQEQVRHPSGFAGRARRPLDTAAVRRR